MWSLPFSFSPFPGQLPVNTTLKVHNVLFSETATALKVMTFDMQLSAGNATSYDAFAQSGGFGTSAWAFVRNYIVDTATLRYTATDVYCVADTAVTAGDRGTVTVIGAITGIAKVGSAAHVLGQQLVPSMATIGTLAPCAAQDTTLATTAGTRKVVGLCTNAATAATANVHFNGFGWGVVFINFASNAYNIDT